MSAEFIIITPASEKGEYKAPRRIMCHAIIAYYENDEHENVIVLDDGIPVVILEEPAFIDSQLNEYRRFT